MELEEGITVDPPLGDNVPVRTFFCLCVCACGAVCSWELIDTSYPCIHGVTIGPHMLQCWRLAFAPHSPFWPRLALQNPWIMGSINASAGSDLDERRMPARGTQSLLRDAC